MTTPDDALQRFRASMRIDYERWHDGVGYDLSALAELSEAERRTVESELAARATADWRDVEALAALGTPTAIAALGAAWSGGDAEIRLAILRYAPDSVTPSDRVTAIVHGLEHAELYGGLSQAIDHAALYHPPPVLYALHRALLRRDGQTAVLLAGLLYHVLGRSEDVFDWSQRPLFLKFDTEDRDLRRAAYLELCALAGAAPLL